jgi:hypothetical protein
VLFAALILSAGALTASAYAEEAEGEEAPKTFPRIEGTISVEIQGDFFDSDNADSPDSDIYNTTEIEVGWYFNRFFSIQAGFVFEPVTDADPGQNRVFDDHGLYAEQLYAQLDLAPFRLFAGKFNPAFGKAWDVTPGVYGADLAEDSYELVERLGGGVAVTRDAGRLGSITLTGSAFFLDNSFLEGSAFRERDAASEEVGIPSNSGALDSFSLALDGADIPALAGVSWHIAYLHQEQGRLFGADDADFTDQDAFAFSLYGEHKFNSVGLEWIGEVVYIDGFSASEDSNNYESWFFTAGAKLTFDKYNIAAAYTHNSNEGFATRAGDDFDVNQFSVSVGREIYDGWSLDLGYKYLEEADEETHVVGFLLAKEIEFNTGRLDSLKK